MNYDRACEILKSPDIIEVTYQGTPVWIHDLQRNGVTASVSYGQESGTPVPVPIHDLVETQGQR